MEQTAGRGRRSAMMKVELESVEGLYPFVLTEDQEHLRREIRDFAAREVAPNMMAWDEASEFPTTVVKKLGAMGLLGVIIPPEYGGAGLGYVDYVLAIEELSYFWLGMKSKRESM
jgi:alkylation response protein AidB-like acyl-CoA dehydrogenase